MTVLGARHVEAAVVPAPEAVVSGRSPEEIRAEFTGLAGAAESGGGDRPILLTVARLAQQKGLEALLDVAASFAPSSAAGTDAGENAAGQGGAALPEGRALFLVAGDGPLRGNCSGGSTRSGCRCGCWATGGTSAICSGWRGRWWCRAAGRGSR
nr:hypothetical protein GCM10020093_029920 [Planobispora longispora]